MRRANTTFLPSPATIEGEYFTAKFCAGLNENQENLWGLEESDFPKTYTAPSAQENF